MQYAVYALICVVLSAVVVGGVPSALRCEVEEAVRSGASLGDLLETKMGPEGASKVGLSTYKTA